uniref:hypothetical protein n=1 Tax=Caulobacter sp. S45 TaxID=1641861 RepID=UPI0015764A41
MSDMVPRLRPGDRLPFCYGMDARQRYWSFEDQAGAACVLICAGAEPPSAAAALADAFSAQAAAFAGRGAQVWLLARAGAPGW